MKCAAPLIENFRKEMRGRPIAEVIALSVEVQEAMHAEDIEEFMQATGMDRVEARFAVVAMLADLKTHKPQLTPWEVDAIAAKRWRAREEKDFKTADYLRDVLVRAGCRVADKPVEVAG